MKFYKLLILIIINTSFLMSQFTQVFINIDYSNINENQMFVFDGFESEIKSYFLNNHFFHESKQLDLTLDINMIIENLNDKGGEKIISAQVLFSNKIDQHFFSKSFDFIYYKNQALYKSEIFHSLSSLLSFYAYIFIANELDTYEYLGGNKYFLKAQNIASDGKNSFYTKNWHNRLKKVRRYQENLVYRDLRYNFFSVYDILESENYDLELANNLFFKFYESILEYESYYNYTKPLIYFLNAYNKDIVRIARVLNFKTIIEYLIIYDETNLIEYQKFYND